MAGLTLLEEAIEFSETISLEECFNKVLKGIPVELNINNLNHILKKDLGFNLLVLKPKVKLILPYMLVHFIKTWTGWQKSLNKKISAKQLYSKFSSYLRFKVNYMIKNDYETAKALVSSASTAFEESVFKIDNSTQTDFDKNNPAYCLEIAGPPKLLNTIVFCDNRANITIKEHRNLSPWINLSPRQLLNWPCIDVHFSTADFSFTRSNQHYYDKFLSLASEKTISKQTDEFIEEIEILDPERGRKVYSLNFLLEYFRKYMELLYSHQQRLRLNVDFLNEVKAVLDDFILDINEINLNRSLATNTSVLFNIGRSIYARNKRVRKGNDAVCYTESIIPKLKISLNHFNSIIGVTRNPLEVLEESKDSLTDNDFLYNCIPLIKYSCTFCRVVFTKTAEILNHLKSSHTMEQPVLCFNCKLEYTITDLTQNRWSHVCVSV